MSAGATDSIVTSAATAFISRGEHGRASASVRQWPRLVPSGVLTHTARTDNYATKWQISGRGRHVSCTRALFLAQYLSLNPCTEHARARALTHSCSHAHARADWPTHIEVLTPRRVSACAAATGPQKPAPETHRPAQRRYMPRAARPATLGRPCLYNF